MVVGISPDAPPRGTTGGPIGDGQEEVGQEGMEQAVGVKPPPGYAIDRFPEKIDRLLDYISKVRRLTINDKGDICIYWPSGTAG